MKDYLMKIQSLHNYEFLVICVILILVGVFFGKLKNK